MLDGLSCPEHPPLIRVEHGDGVLTYVVAASPDTLSPVTERDLARAWDAARRNASPARAPCRFRFERDDGDCTEFALYYRAARQWAEAVDDIANLSTFYGLSLLVRLLALSALLLARPAEGAARRGGVPDPGKALLRAAASAPLDALGGFDAKGLRTLLAGATPLAKESGA